jgi:hypothetical protein
MDRGNEIVEVEITADGRFDEPVDAQEDPVFPGLRTVDNALCNYFLDVNWVGEDAAADSVLFEGFQITYTST